MKSLKWLLFTPLLFTLLLHINAQTGDTIANTQQIKEGRIEVYYFHKAHRCVSCRALQIETDKALKELYPEEIKDGKLVYLTYSIDEESNFELMEQFDIQSQKLFVLKGNQQKELTDTAVSIIRSSHPERLKQLLRDTIDNMKISTSL